MVLPALFHWSPADRREDILRDGLKPYCAPTAHSDLTWPYLCFSPTPSRAFGLSADLFDEIEAWDLWQVRLTEHDEVHICPLWGDVVTEIRVRNAIPADRVWWVARRESLVARCEHGGTTTAECPGCFPAP